MDSTRSTLALAATSASARLEDVVRFWIRESGIDYRVVSAPAGEVLEHLRDAQGLIRTNTAGLNALVVRFSDLGSTDARRWIAEFGAGLSRAHAEGPARTIVVRCPEVARIEDLPSTLSLETELRAALHGLARLEFIDGAAVRAAAGGSSGHVAWPTVVGTLVARRVHAAGVRPRRVLAVGCDDVLWTGRCGEMAPGTLVVDEHRRALQTFLRGLVRDGWQLCLSARGSEVEVRRVFARRPDMPLTMDDIAAVDVGWKTPSESIGALSAKLGAPVGDFVVLSAREDECHEMAFGARGTLALSLPRNAARASRFVRHVWAFDHSPLHVAPAGGERVRQVGAHGGVAPRQASVGVRAASSYDRIAELTHAARHFSTTGSRPSAAELAWFARERGREVLAVEAPDDAGGPGLVGALRVRRVGDVLRVDDWWMLDAALGKGLERQVLRELGRRAIAAACDSLEIACLPSHRSEPARYCIESLGVPLVGGEYKVPVGMALACAEPPERQRAAPAPAARETEFYRRAAGPLATPEGVLRAMAKQGDADAAGAYPYRLPRTGTERWLADLWRDLLGVDRVGAHDDFFALGGDSLTGARVLGRIKQAFGIDMELPAMYETSTLETLAGRLMRARLANADPHVVRSLLADESSRAPA